MSAEAPKLDKNWKEKAKDLWLKSDGVIAAVALTVAAAGVITGNPLLVEGGVKVAALQGAEHVGKKALFDDGDKKGQKERAYGVFANMRNQLPTKENPGRLFQHAPTSRLGLAA